MNCYFKRAAVIAIAVIMMVTFVGCNNEELVLYNAISKMQDITYSDQKTEVSFRFDYQGEKSDELERIKIFLGGLKLAISQNYSVSKSKDLMSASVNALITLGDMTYNYKVWLDANMTDKDPYYKQVIGVPFIAKVALPEEYRGKEYFVMDSTKISDENEEAKALKELPQLNKDIVEQANDFVKKFMAGFEPGVKIVHKGNSSSLNGERVSIYELRLDDASLKSLVRRAVNDFAKDEEAIKVIKESVLAFYDLYELENTDEYDEMKSQIENAEENIPEFLEQFNMVMDQLNDIKILGDKGISINYYINKSGYIVKQEGSIDLLINIKELAEAFDMNEDDYYPITADAISLGIDFANSYDNINKNLDVKLPEINESNSIDFYTMMKDMNKPYEYNDYSYQEEEEPGLKIKYYGSKIHFENEIITQDEVLYVPAKELMDRMYLNSYWDSETQTLYGFARNSFIRFLNNENTLYVKDQKHTLSDKAFLNNNVLYVPLRSFAEALGYSVEWDGNTESVNIQFDYSNYDFEY